MNYEEISPEWIDRYTENSLTPDERTLFEACRKSSPMLDAEVRIDAKLERFLSDPELLDLLAKMDRASRDRLRKRDYGLPWLMAASVLALLVFGATIGLLRRHTILPPADYRSEQTTEIRGR